MKWRFSERIHHNRTKSVQSVRHTWILLFGIFILIALILMSMYFSNVNRIISENLEEYNQAKLGQTKASLDLAIARLVSTADSIAADRTIYHSDAATVEETQQVIRSINHHITYNSSVLRVLLLSRESKTVVSDMGTSLEPFFYAANFSEEYFSKEKWQSLFYGDNFSGYIELPMLVDGRKTENRIAYIRPSEHSSGNVVVILNSGAVLEADPYFYRVMMLNREGDLFSVSGTGKEEVVIDYGKLTGKSGIYEFSDERYISYVNSAIDDLKYILFTDKEVFMKNLGETRWLTGLYLTLYFIIGLLLAIWFSKKQYAPIKSIAELFKFNSGDGKNEYDVIKSGINTMLQENAGISREMEKRDTYLREHAVINLLKGKQTDKKFGDTLGEALLSEQKEMLCVKLLWNSLQSDALNYSDMISYALKNVSEEIFSELGEVYSAETDDSVVNLIFLKEANSVLKRAEEASHRLLELVKKYLELDLEIVLGRVVKTKEEISVCYEEMMEASQLRGLQQEKIIFAYETAKRNQGEYAYSLKTEIDLISLIKNGDADAAITLITQTVQEMLWKKKLSIYTLRCFLIDLESTVLKVLDEIEHKNDTKMEEDFLNLNELFRANSISRMQQIVCESVRTVCDFVLQNNSCYGSDLCEEIRQYIRANYANPLLNVNQLAKDIHMNATYISSTFKKNTGVRLLEYINQIRVEEAKKLMLEKPEFSMEMIAEMTGFANTRTFRRVFGKYEEVSPGKYVKN